MTRRLERHKRFVIRSDELIWIAPQYNNKLALANRYEPILRRPHTVTDLRLMVF